MTETQTILKASDLRIGNLVELRDKKFTKVWSIDENGINVIVEPYEEDGRAYAALWGDIIPIPLTPEILEKCGFIKGRDKDYPKSIADYYRKGRWLIKLTGPEYDCEIRISISWHKNITHITSLHQLQNLYFALLGEELEINL